ncbi:Ig-like domain-containing protein [Roseisolibacter sp. H3M3-2]|uniref:Ig-like domain-containing protein n=1 Tax=Roseisolibacter sp. H3M3-2 TaxID=3031323 RepID=UPI0023DCA90F|nr:Ig-like domain-containing protein [Roseisolibacter sp. H3M3-2]MDF1504375.1 Ig-like domain-containing protein [Roseisolibacter sp. H3M3-2]
MRYFAIRALGLAVASVAAAGCSFITGVPDVDRVRVTLSPSTIAATSTPAQITGEALRKDGSVINHSRRVVTFRSSNPAVATVSGTGNGVVAGVTAGSAYIIGESGGKKDSALVTVTPAPPATIQIDPTFPRVRVGGTASVAVRPIGNNGQPLTGFTVACQSSTPTILGAAASGTNCALNGIATGTAVLRVTVNGVFGQDFNVIVENETPASVRVGIRSPLRVGETLNVPFELRRADGSVIPSAGRTCSYTSSNNAVLVVNGSGVLQTQAEGSATVTVNCDNVTGTQTVEVTKIPVVEVVLPQAPVFRVQAQNVLRAVPLDSLNRELATAGRLVRFTAADPTVLTINSTTGIITPLKSGTTEITVRIDSVERKTTATVTPIPVGAVRINNKTIDGNPGTTFQYTAQVLDSLNRVLTDRTVRWTSGNSAIVSINQTTGLATAIQPGSVQITAIAERVPGRPVDGEVGDAGVFNVFAAPVARIVVAPTTVSLRAGAATLVSLVAQDAAGNQLFGRTVAATSADPAVAVADGSGRVQAIGVGTTTIRFQAVTAGNQPEGAPAELTVTVTATSASVRPARATP